VAHLFAILFFSGLLVALGMVAEVILRENWAAMRAALAGAPLSAPQVPARPAREQASPVRLPSLRAAA